MVPPVDLHFTSVAHVYENFHFATPGDDLSSNLKTQSAWGMNSKAKSKKEEE